MTPSDFSVLILALTNLLTLSALKYFMWRSQMLTNVVAMMASKEEQ